MVLTQPFEKLVQERVERDPAFGAALLREESDTMLSRDADSARAILRVYIKTTLGVANEPP